MSTPLGGNRSRGGQDRFYRPPAMRRKQSESEKSTEKVVATSDESTTATAMSTSLLQTENACNLSNLDQFIENTTPVVQAQRFSKTNMKELRTHGDDFLPYFVLDDLWESLKEWSAYGAGVPLVLSGGDSVVQYYVPYLSAIQLYIDPSMPSMRLRKLGEERDGVSSSHGSSDHCGRCRLENGINYVQVDRNLQNQENAAKECSSRLSLRNNLVTGSAVNESEISNPPGLLLFEYFAHDLPYAREPLADKILKLASQFPELRTCRSCDLTPSSWISVAWYPIYRIPVGTTLNNIDACFLTFHSLSTLYGIVPTNIWACSIQV
ncbi:uncharacterized protein LOC108221718 isoform X3 [Daucus carota subsp. sativus]|uniref:uncharacterized protein LOC108221718 isoform X3 n=1 Tax=Daucus carota subsp. sativus TaxID=79200 RepID=UPI003082D349